MPETNDTFGFGAASQSVKDRIKQIRPSAPVHASDMDSRELERVDAVAEGAGFVSREAPPLQPVYTYRYGRQRPEPRIPLNMRVPVSLGQAFQKFCEDNRYSYPEALEEVMKRAGLPTRLM